MEESKKKLFEYLREIYKLKTRVIMDYNKYEKNIDIDVFKNNFSNIVDIHEFSPNISENEEYFLIKYISDEMQFPMIPEDIKPYIDITENGIVLQNDVEISEEITKRYKDYINEYEKTKKTNSLIQKNNEIYEYLYTIQRKKEEYDAKIEVVFCKGLFVYKPSENSINSTIRRHVFEAPVIIDINQKNNTIYLRLDRQTRCNIESNFVSALKGFKIKEQNNLYKLKEKIQEKFENAEIINFDELFEEYLNTITFRYEYVKDSYYSAVEEEKCYIFNKDSIIVRKKQPTIWLDDINNILKYMEENGKLDLDNKLIDLILETNTGAIDELLNSKIENDRILFPLPSNDEQFRVVNQTQNSNLVLVQGPPGTGKSHTITNMISTYVANGKRILVTSEKSKALDVIKDKLPKEIQDLSMTLLSDSKTDKELVRSVQRVLEKYKDKSYLSLYKERIEKLEQELDSNNRKQNENQKKIIQILVNNMEDNKEELQQLANIELNSYRLIDIAKFLEEHKEYNIISDNNNFKSLEFNKEFLFEFNIIVEELKELKKFVIEREYDLPKDLDFDTYLHSIERLNELEKKLIDNSIKEGINEKIAQNYDLSIILDILNQLIKLENLYGKQYIQDNCNFVPRIKNVENIINFCLEQKDFIEQVETELIGNSVKYNESNRFEYSKALNKINEKLLNDGKISFIEKIQLKKELELVSEILINNKKFEFEEVNDKNLKLILSKIQYDIKVNRVIDDINSVLKKSTLFDNINKDEFSRKIDEVVNVLTSFVKYTEYVTNIKNALKDIFRGNKNIEREINDENFVIILELVEKTLNYEKIIEIKEDYNNLLKELEDKTLKTRYVFEELINAVKEKNIEKYSNEYQKIQRIYGVSNKYKEIENKYKNETENYKMFIVDYIDMEENQRLGILNEFESIFNYYKIKMFLYYKELNNSHFSNIFEENKKLKKEEKDIIIKLIAEKSWYSQIDKMNSSTCRNLAEWMQLKTKLGKGTGKRANIIRKEMQEKMKVAKDAFPIWIMPVDKVIEQYPFNVSPQFDVIIMDESSQSSILSITALLRGRKCIIVGDDKQISPIEVGINLDDLKALQNEFLSQTCLGVGFDMETSLYDIAQNVCGSKKVVLKEHFRCLPEIIEFSNSNFYGNEINCLKIRGKENTIKEPIKSIFVEGATVKRISASNLLNEKEVNKIIDILKEIENDYSYKDKTIGIIALQNSTPHINYIYSEIWKNFSSEFMNERKIKVGNAYDFQGDERDVIILSMVTSKIQEDGEVNHIMAMTKKEYERSFNVAASRAKEQSILVYSVKPEELNNNCLRYKLINYYLTYKNNKQEKKENEFFSDFELDIYRELKRKNIDLISHFKIGKYMLDFIIENNDGKKIAIECDGDIYNTEKEYETEMKKQEVLERCGWTFIRIRASQYYFNKEKCIDEIMKKINTILNDDSEREFIKSTELQNNFFNRINEITKNNENDNIDEIIKDNETEDKSLENIRNKLNELSETINITNLYNENEE